MGRKRKYFTEEERKAAQRKASRRWKANNKEKNAGYMVEYRKTPKGRAKMLIDSYRGEDKKYNRGECTLTADWVVENIFSQPCAHCGKIGWNIIGCNRLDNSLPHTPDNVEPCCCECNIKLAGKEKSKPVYQYTKDGELLAVWPSAAECGRNGFTQCKITDCINGKLKTHKGYIWSYEPIINNKV